MMMMKMMMYQVKSEGKKIKYCDLFPIIILKFACNFIMKLKAERLL